MSLHCFSHISMLKHLYCGGCEMHDALYLLLHCLSWLSRESSNIHSPYMYKFDWSVTAAVRATRSETPLPQTCRVFPLHRGCHSQKQMFFFGSHVNLLMSAVVWNTVHVNQHLQRWGRSPFVIPRFVFLSWHSVLLSAWHNEERAVCSESPGSLSQHGGLPRKYAEASAGKKKPALEWWFIHTKEKLLT